MKNYLWLFLLTMLFSHPLLAGDKKAEPTLAYGASVYQARCTLCHGNQGYGDGMLPLSMKKYPHTNLHETNYGKDIDSLRKSIIYGGSKSAMNNEMPPWGDELTYTQVESVAMFVHLMLTDRKKSDEIMAKTTKQTSVSVRAGRNLFKNFCGLCHGPDGEGDGKMAKIIKNPPPFNLTKSTVADEYLELIIMKGGGAIGRSPRMPPWAEQLTKDEIKSIVLYLKTIRK